MLGAALAFLGAGTFAYHYRRESAGPAASNRRFRAVASALGLCLVGLVAAGKPAIRRPVERQCLLPIR